MNYDSFFMSNGEPLEQLHYDLAKDSFPDIKWTRGYSPRDVAIKQCASSSNTDYFFCIPAKLRLEEKYQIQINLDEQPKHYVFYCRNVLNDLVYGHQGMILYNKKLVLDTNEWDLDFTMAQPFKSIFMTVGTAVFNQSPYITWRTAFREVIKLLLQQTKNPDDRRNNNRLNTWLNHTNGGQYSEWCIRGANDAKEFFLESNQDLMKLKCTFDWQWLYNYSKKLNYYFDR